jgi:mannose-6-phosphate isomerase
MNSLYPLKFEPILKDKIWGGTKLKTVLNKKYASDKCGESWEISGYGNDISVVSNGTLKGKNLSQLIEDFKGELVGAEVYQLFQNNFPLLIKFIDANDDLSVQVHPNDAMAKERHNSFGKTEMWYVLDSEHESKLISGFNQPITQGGFLKMVNDKKVIEVLNFEEVAKGDVFLLPAGRIHAIGSGILLAEIQQSSDVTYRVYDWDRVDDKGKPRELHLDLSLEAIDYKHYDSYREHYKARTNETTEIVNCKYFKTSLIDCNQPITKNYALIDSFVIYMCVEGEYEVDYGMIEKIVITKGESILIPACMKNIKLIPTMDSKILEVYVP